MSAVRSSSFLLVAGGLMLVGGATGSLIDPIGVVVLAAVGLLWALLLAVVVGWLGRAGRQRWGVAILFLCFVPIGLLAGSLPDDRGLGAVAVVAVVVVGAVLVGFATWLGRIPAAGEAAFAREAWTSAVLGVSVCVAGLLAGSALSAQLLFGAALADAPDVFARLIQGYVGDAQSLPYYMFNPSLEWLLMPLLVLLAWPLAWLRPLLVAAFVVFVLSRTWTYLAFVPQISEWENAASLTPQQLDQAGTWTALSWVRFAVDLTLTALLLIAAVQNRTGERKHVPAMPDPAR